MKFLHGFRKTGEERDARTVRDAIEIARRAEERILDEALDKIVFFPGDLGEYESFVGYRVNVVDTVERNKAVRFREDGLRRNYEVYGDIDFKRHLVGQKVEALVNCGYANESNFLIVYGLPVAKAEQSPDNALLSKPK